jgi:hypothetical protein
LERKARFFCGPAAKKCAKPTDTTEKKANGVALGIAASRFPLRGESWYLYAHAA